MLAAEFFREVTDHLEKVRTTQEAALQAAAHTLASAVAAKSRTFVFGSGHSNLLTQECCLRAGGLPIYNPIFVAGLLPTDYPYLRCGLMERISGIAAAALETTGVREGDAIIIISNSGRNHVPVEMALESSKRGMHVIAMTSVEFSSQAKSRHPSGKKLYELAEVVLDNCCPPGDAAVAVPGVPAKIGPLSTIMGAVLLHALSCKVIDLLIKQGITLPVFASGNVDGTEEYSKRILESYRDLIA